MTKTHTLPYIPLRDVVVFPHNEVVLTFGRPQSIAAINKAMQDGRVVALFTQRNSDQDNPQISDVHPVGTLCKVERTLKTDGEFNVLVRGVSRIKLSSLVTETPIPTVEVVELETKIEAKSEQLEALAKHLTEQFRMAVGLGKSVEFMHFMRLVSGVSASELADQIAATLSTKTETRQALLENLDLIDRLFKINELLAREIKVLEIEKNIASKTQEKFSKSMRENVLRERLETIKKELGEDGGDEEDLDELYLKLKKLPVGKKWRDRVLKEFNKLERMSSYNPESGYIRTWLETLVDLPWDKNSSAKASLKTAQKVMDEDHYGLLEIKERIIEYLAVLKLKAQQEKSQSLPTILCFVGPPGVGKTSLGRSIARALRRKFVKVSLGGIRDEAEIRGHRKTYVGAMPGRIVEGMRQAGTLNPVFMLDEIDKIGNDFRGDPSAALLEALDPEQNKEFSDHYLELPYDLSNVIFIATANTLDTIPTALRDRLEVIRFAGYTPQEKVQIAKNHLLPKVIEKNALPKGSLKLNGKLLAQIISDYTREAGVRALERELARLARKAAHQLATKKDVKFKLSSDNLIEYLDAPRYDSTQIERKHPVGQATGLAWTAVGGEILFVEVAIMPGKGRITITGQLGDVMKESTQAAFSFIRSHYLDLGLKKDFYKDQDIHIHIPEGAVPKDGPSAGITMATAMVSAFTKKRVKKTLAMTGEITLRGRVLEIGGLKEKVIAAHAAGIKEVIIPARNEKDLKKIPKEVTNTLTFHPVSDISEVFSLALL